MGFAEGVLTGALDRAGGAVEGFQGLDAQATIIREDGRKLLLLWPSCACWVNCETE